MADIELVIKIPEGLKNDFESERWTALSCMEMKNALEKATLLPKGHGRIIDESQVTGTFTWDNGYIECYAPTIIEADKESEE